MSKIYISEQAAPPLIEYLLDEGHTIVIIGDGSTKIDTHPAIARLAPAENVDPAICCHPDIRCCHMGDGKVFHGVTERLGFKYPADVPYNAASTGRYFIHNLKHTAPELLETAKQLGLELIHVSQGYAKCSICVVDNDSVITYDRGIAAACALRAPALNVLLVSPGHIELAGYAAGFIGGTCGRVGDAVIFNGDLSAHPDFVQIKEFIESRGLRCVWFPGHPLTDIGSVIEEK